MVSQCLLLPQVITPYMKYIVVYKFFLSRRSCLVFFYLEHNTISVDIKPNIHSFNYTVNCELHFYKKEPVISN